MAWTPPSDAVAVQPTTSWKPPSDAVVAKAEKPVREEVPPSGSPMGEGLGAAIMGEAAPRDPKTFTGSVFDTQPFEPVLTTEEAIRLSRRAYAEQTTKPAVRGRPTYSR